MYNRNGIIYGGEPEKHLKVEKIVFFQDKKMLVSFSDGKIKVFDANSLSGEAFVPVKDEKVLKECVIDHGVPTWCNGKIDCAPEYLYENGKEVATEYEFESADTPMVSE